MLSISDHRVSAVLLTFDKKKIKKFGQYLASPYPGYPEKARRLGAYLLAFYPNFESENLQAEKIYGVMEPDGPFSQHELIRYLSILLTALEDFIAIESLQSTPWSKDYLIAEYFFETQDEAGFRKGMNRVDKSLQAIKKQDSQHVFYHFLAKKLAFNHQLRQKNVPTALEFLEQAHNQFDHYYFGQIFQAAMSENLLGRKEKHSIHLLEPACEVMEKHGDGFPPLTQLWYLSYLLSEKLIDESRYKMLKQALIRHANTLPKPDARGIAATLNISLRRQKGKDRLAYLQERFDTYLLEIEHGWLIVHGTLGHNTFINIVIGALALDKTDFAEKFIHENKVFLLTNVRSSIVYYTMALISFKKKKFKDCLFLCQKVRYFEDTVSLGTKRLQLMCHWELKEAEQLGIALNTLRVFLFRMKKSQHVLHDRNKAFYKAMSLLSKDPLHTINKKTLERLEKVIEENPYLPELEWLQAAIARN